MAGSKALVEHLLGEMRALAAEARRKQPDVRDAAERAVLRLRVLAAATTATTAIAAPPAPTAAAAAAGGTGAGAGAAGARATAASIAARLAETDELVRPLLLAFDTRSARLAQPAAAMLQKLASQGAVPAETVDAVLDRLAALQEIALEEVRSVQILLMLLSSAGAGAGARGATLARAIVQLFRHYLHGSDATVTNTAAATIRQAAIIVFDRVDSRCVMRARSVGPHRCLVGGGGDNDGAVGGRDEGGLMDGWRAVIIVVVIASATSHHAHHERRRRRRRWRRSIN